MTIDFFVKSPYSCATISCKHLMPPPAREKAVQFLLKPPAVRYLRKLRESLEREPDYLGTHREDVANVVIGFLAGSGLQWHREIFEKEWEAILRIALRRLPGKKR
jgi:hypothetical protein